MENRPDSAQQLLEAISRPERLSEEEYATWCLLVTQARDKNYVVHTSDSVIDVAVRYFAERDDLHRKAQAYYCQGRVLSDLDISEEALEAYLRAKDVVPSSGNFDLQARINNHLGSLYWENGNVQESLASYRKAYQAYAHEANAEGKVNTLCNLGFSWLDVNQPDSAMACYKEALDLIETGQSSQRNDVVYSSVGTFYEMQGDHATALDYYKKALLCTDDLSLLDTRYYNLGDSYLSLGQLDSAACYAEKITGSSDLFVRCGAYELLYRLAKERQTYQEALAYNDTYLQLKDSIEQCYRPQELARIKALYGKERLESRHYRQMQEADVRMLLLVIVALASLFVGAFVYFYFNRKYALQQQRNRDMQKVLEENRQQLEAKEQALEENRAKQATVQHLFDESRKEKERLQQEWDERLFLLKDDSRKLQEEYEARLEQLAIQSQQMLDEKETILHEQIALVNQKEQLLQQRDAQLGAVAKGAKLYKEQAETLVEEQRKNGREVALLRSEIEKLRKEKEEQLLQEQKNAEEYRLRCAMYENWQQELLARNRCLLRLQNHQALSVWTEKEWEEFMENFEKVYPKFVNRLLFSFDLDERKVRIVCLTKFGLKTGKVAALFGLSNDTIRKEKSDIHKHCFPESTDSSLDKLLRKWY